ncbi:MAG: hypothetical protein LBC64_10930 [Fibromonadaceae bacterium]|nr:hypothetical protein [Fibromonadaceae bacterium]
MNLSKYARAGQQLATAGAVFEELTHPQGKRYVSEAANLGGLKIHPNDKKKFAKVENLLKTNDVVMCPYSDYGGSGTMAFVNKGGKIIDVQEVNVAKLNKGILSGASKTAFNNIFPDYIKYMQEIAGKHSGDSSDTETFDNVELKDIKGYKFGQIPVDDDGEYISEGAAQTDAKLVSKINALIGRGTVEVPFIQGVSSDVISILTKLPNGKIGVVADFTGSGWESDYATFPSVEKWVEEVANDYDDGVIDNWKTPKLLKLSEYGEDSFDDAAEYKRFLKRFGR